MLIFTERWEISTPLHLQTLQLFKSKGLAEITQGKIGQ